MVLQLLLVSVPFPVAMMVNATICRQVLDETPFPAIWTVSFRK
jgi:hypothetical protein